MVVRLDRTRSLKTELKCASSLCFAFLASTQRSIRLASTTITSTPRSVNDVEVRLISNLLVGGLLPVSVSCSCDLLIGQLPKYQATGVSSGQEAPKTASLSLTVLRVLFIISLLTSECSMTWTKLNVLCSYTSYCTVVLEKKKKKVPYMALN